MLRPRFRIVSKLVMMKPTTKPPLRLVLLWHMHQPDFRDCVSGEFTQPWVYLHAIKDYSDMAAHLENHAGVHAVVNLVPILLDQLEDYAHQFAGGQVRDPLLRLLASEDLDALSQGERELLLTQCFRAYHEKMIDPYPPYKRLRDLYRALLDLDAQPARYLSGQYLADLITWYHLSWTGETVRRSHPWIAQLMARGENFSHTDRMQVFNLIGTVIADIVPRYRKLAQSGRIELSTTPHYHPLSPLLLDFAAARETLPDAPLPNADHYPDGRARVTWHLRTAQASHSKRFAVPAAGMWPAEGALSGPFLQLQAEHGVTWTASGEGVLTNTLKRAGVADSDRERMLYRPYRAEFADHRIHCFFRDDLLSDLIGFEYKDWHGKAASADFVARLEALHARAPQNESPVVSVILDGENAWEHYPYNAFYFLDELYATLETHAEIKMATFSEVIAEPQGGASAADFVRTLPPVVAGSWVHGNVSTWIGSPEKNRAWDLLVAAKRSYDTVVTSTQLSEDEKTAAATQLAVCEGSDWFWWFGDYNPAESVVVFDLAFRNNLRNLYRLLRLPSPEALAEPISRGSGHPALGGAMRRAA